MHLPNPEIAISFCQNIGLPINTTNGNRVVMKAAPICVQGSNDVAVQQLINPGRDEDNFVFSSYYYYWLEGGKKEKLAEDEFEGMSSLQRAMAKAKISQNTASSAKSSKGDKDTQSIKHDEEEWMLTNCDSSEPRLDQDGVKILPSCVLRKLIFL